MRKYIRSTLLLLLLTVALVTAGCGGAGVSLHMVAGQENRSHLTTDIEMTMNMQEPAAAQGKSQVTMKVEYDTVTKVNAVSKEEAEFSYTITGMKTTATMDGKPLSMPSGMIPDGTTITLKVNPTTGEVKEITGLPQIQGGQAISEEQFKEMIKNSFSQLPKTGKVKVGDSWTAEVPVPLSQPGITVDNAPKLTVTAKYEGNETKDGVSLAKISMTASAPMDTNMSMEGSTANMKGTMSVSGVQYLDLKTGMVHSATAESSTSVIESFEKAGQKFVLRVDMTMKMTLTPAK